MKKRTPTTTQEPPEHLDPVPRLEPQNLPQIPFEPLGRQLARLAPVAAVQDDHLATVHHARLE